MLVLSRRIDEKIIINDNIIITIVDIKGNQIRLGIEAPKDVPITRGELIRGDLKETETKPSN